MRKDQVLPPPGGTYPPGAADPKGDAGVDAGWLLLQGMVLGLGCDFWVTMSASL